MAVERNRSGKVNRIPTIIVISACRVLSATMLESAAQTMPNRAATTSMMSAPATPVSIRAPMIRAITRTTAPCSSIRNPSAMTLPSSTLERRMGLMRNLSSIPTSRSVTIPIPDWKAEVRTVIVSTLGAKNMR